MRLVISVSLAGLLGVGTGCKNAHASPQTAATPAVTPPAVTPPVRPVAPEPPVGFEVEMYGTLLENVKAPRYIAYLSPSPCDVKTLATTYVKALAHPDPATPKRTFYLEPVALVGERQFLCGAALDRTGKQVLAFGSYPKNPIIFEAPEKGEDDADIKGLDFKITKLAKAVSISFDRF